MTQKYITRTKLKNKPNKQWTTGEKSLMTDRCVISIVKHLNT